MNQNIQDKWIELQEELTDLGSVDFIPKRHYIGLNLNGSNICYLNFRKSHILIDILGGTVYSNNTKSKNFLTLEDPKKITSERSRELNSGGIQISYRITFNASSDLDYVMFLIRQKYKTLS